MFPLLVVCISGLYISKHASQQNEDQMLSIVTVTAVRKQSKLRTLSITVIEAAGAGCRRAQAKIIRVGNEADLYHR